MEIRHKTSSPPTCILSLPSTCTGEGMVHVPSNAASPDDIFSRVSWLLAENVEQSASWPSSDMCSQNSLMAAKSIMIKTLCTYYLDLDVYHAHRFPDKSGKPAHEEVPPPEDGPCSQVNQPCTWVTPEAPSSWFFFHFPSISINSHIWQKNACIFAQ